MVCPLSIGGASWAPAQQSHFMKKIQALEERLSRAEASLLVIIVLAMLIMALYSILYRNILVPFQRHLSTSGPVVAPIIEEPLAVAPKPAEPGGDTPDQGAGGFGGGFGEEPAKDAAPGGDAAPKPTEGEGAGGFGGGFGEAGAAGEVGEGAQEAPPKPEDAAPKDSAGGFGGGFGEEPAKDAAPEGDAAPKPPEGEGAGGFGGGFGEGAPAEGGDSGGFGGGFGEGDKGAQGEPAVQAPAVAEVVAPPEVGGPPPEGSMAARVIVWIDALKQDWIDVLLRQLVVLMGFLGAMLATRRRKHINIDAISRLLPDQARRVMGVLVDGLSVVVCVFLAIAGGKLVQIGLEFPTELTEWADEWSFQLMYPAGFGLLAVHFGVRTAESAIVLRDGLPVEASGGLEGGPKKMAGAPEPGEAGSPEVDESAPKEPSMGGAASASGSKKKSGKKGGRR